MSATICGADRRAPPAPIGQQEQDVTHVTLDGVVDPQDMRKVVQNTPEKGPGPAGVAAPAGPSEYLSMEVGTP